jgi:hypothetical protein
MGRLGEEKGPCSMKGTTIGKRQVFMVKIREYQAEIEAG